MFPPSGTSGISTRSLSRAFVAVLALLLSALGGIRLAFDRLGGPEDETVLVAALAPHSRSGESRAELSVAAPAALPGSPAGAAPSRPAAVADGVIPAGAAWRPAPTTRMGSAGGPRAP
jgi:hypothetical protein